MMATVEEYIEPTDMRDYLRTGRAVKKGRHIFLEDEGNMSESWIVIDGLVWQADFPGNIDEQPAAVVVPCRGKDNKYLLLKNGDTDNDFRPANDVEIGPEYAVTFSVNCLSRMLNGDRWNNDSTIRKMLHKLAEGAIKVVDFTPDQEVRMSKNDRAKYQRWTERHSNERTDVPPIEPPELGFTLMGGVWHRSASILFRVDKMSILMGQDEGSYFAVELADNPRTIGEAFESLVPPEVRGKKFQRQGEWFAVECDEEDVPKIGECLLEASDITLGREDENSNYHELSGDIRVSKDGLIYANGNLTHEQHENLRLRNWAVFYRNTAVRSVSIEGVD